MLNVGTLLDSLLVNTSNHLLSSYMVHDQFRIAPAMRLDRVTNY